MDEGQGPVTLRANNASEWTGPTGTNTYLLPGEVPTLVDAGIGDPQHLAAIEHALGGDPLAMILVTHDHPDHAAGIPALRARWPGVRVRGAGRDGLRDGETLRAGDRWLRAIHTPGHAPDHVCLFDEAAGDVYCGDLARDGGTIVIPGRGGDLAAYLRSLRMVAALAPRRLLPGHGPIVEDPAALIARYLAHREARERQIVEALGAGCTTASQIVTRIYGSLTPALTRAATDSVLAHLRKLSMDGRVAERNDEWILTVR